VHLPAKPGEQLRSSIDIALAKRVLGWQPTVGLKEGLRQTIEFFRAQSKREGSGPG
jgi:UDP-glucose 4-epimerase